MQDNRFKDIFEKSQKEDGVFINPWNRDYVKMMDMFKYVFTHSKPDMPTEEELNKEIPLTEPDMELIKNPSKDKIYTTWIGHASILTQSNGFNILFDPVFSERCSPSQWIGPKRLRPVPFTSNQLDRVDICIISHNHYDHLDYQSVIDISKLFNPYWIVPLGIKQWFDDLKIDRVIEMDWGEKIILQRNELKELIAFTSFEEVNDKEAQASIICCPAQHFSNRGLFDKNVTLWSSWLVITDNNDKVDRISKKIYFGGDTGYNDKIFKEVGDTYKEIDISYIPIGAYEPRKYFQCIHCNPEEAVQIHIELKSKLTIPIHYGTFNLSYEPFLEPKFKLFEEVKKREDELKDTKIYAMKIGETLIS